jgi:hypothetical protein
LPRPGARTRQNVVVFSRQEYISLPLSDRARSCSTDSEQRIRHFCLLQAEVRRTSVMVRLNFSISCEINRAEGLQKWEVVRDTHTSATVDVFGLPRNGENGDVLESGPPWRSKRYMLDEV